MADEELTTPQETPATPEEAPVGVLGSPLEMSDEELMKLDPTRLQDAPEAEEESDDEPDPEIEKEEDEPEDEPVATRQDVFMEDVSSEEEPEEAEEEEPEELLAEDSEPDDSRVDYKAEYQKLLAPFKASDREVSIKSVDDAIRLMQMGVDYQVKMQALKPSLRIVKALDRNDLLDVDKVNQLIDLEKGTPEAVVQFLKQKGINPLDLDLDEERTYTPENHAPSEREMALDEVLDSIRGTDSFDRTISELGEKWDEESKEILWQNPQLVGVINGHISAGIYDKIMNVVTSERMLGRLQGMSNLAAYKQIGDALQAQGAFNDVSKGNGKRKPAPESKPESKIRRDKERSDRKREAGSPRGKPAAPSQADFNPLAMSDEEIEKIRIPGLSVH